MKIPSILSGCGLLLAFPLTALAADEQPLSAAAGLTTDTFTLILKIGVPSGLISAVFTLIGVFLTNRAAQKNNREKIAAEAENISRQINQRQSEFETQTKLQIESLHSDEKKKVCWDFLASAKPSLFMTTQFNRAKMEECIQPLYLYCKENHFSYFRNLILFIDFSDLPELCAQYEYTCPKQKSVPAELKARDRIPGIKYISENSSYKTKSCDQELGSWDTFNALTEKSMALYCHHYDLALEAAKKLIWNEPIEEAPPIQLEDIPDEDDI